MVHAVNIRDEEGLIAKIIKAAISTSAHVDHIGDMHDRLLMVVPKRRRGPPESGSYRSATGGVVERSDSAASPPLMRRPPTSARALRS